MNLSKGNVLTASNGHTAKVLKITKKEITVEVTRRITVKSTGEVKTEVRTRVVPVDVWWAFARGYD